VAVNSCRIARKKLSSHNAASQAVAAIENQQISSTSKQVEKQIPET
jgi:hypothetical protein